MISEKSKVKIVCDMAGCNNEASYFIKKDSSESNYDSLKLCSDCAKELSKILNKTIKKEKSGEQKD